MMALRLLWVYLRVGVLNELQYRVNFFVQLFRSALGLIVGLGGLAMVFAQTNQLGGWSRPELLALLGVFQLVGGAIRTLVRPSMQRLMEDVRQGTLDFVLTKPADSQALVSVRQVEIWQLTDMATGTAIILVALQQLGRSVGLIQTVAFAGALLAGAVIVYSFWLVLATCSFWFVRTDNILVIFQSMYNAGRWPIGIYPRWLRLSLTFLVPVAFATTVPAEAVAGRLSGATLLGAGALAGALFCVSRWFWSVGVRRYSGASA